MLHTRHVNVNVEGSVAAGTVGLPPSRIAGVFYRFEDDGVTECDLAVKNQNRTVYTKVGALDGDPLYDFDGSGAGHFEPVVHDSTVVEITNAVGTGRVVFSFLLHYPGI